MRPVQGGAILEVQNVGSEFGQRVMNVWHYRWEGAASPVADGDAIVADLKAVIQPGAVGGLLGALRAMCTESMSWNYIRYQWIAPIRYAPVNNALGAGPGTQAGEAMPPNVCGVVTLKSIFAGPGSTGRKHFGGLTTADELQGLMTEQFFDSANLVMEIMKSEVPTGGVQINSKLVPVVLDKVDYTISIPWTEYEIQDTSRVLRRRTVRVGI